MWIHFQSFHWFLLTELTIIIVSWKKSFDDVNYKSIASCEIISSFLRTFMKANLLRFSLFETPLWLFMMKQKHTNLPFKSTLINICREHLIWNCPQNMSLVFAAWRLQIFQFANSNETEWCGNWEPDPNQPVHKKAFCLCALSMCIHLFTAFFYSWYFVWFRPFVLFSFW